MKNKSNYLNVGCGNKYHKDWTNIDMVSYSPDVLSYNILKGIPFDDNKFDVLYHSQVLEHFTKEKAADFIKECFRVLKPDGIIRIVVPDLENIIKEYIKYLDDNLNNPNALSESNYDWILLEMYDQTVRNYSGGQMAEYLMSPNLVNEKYVIDRTGFVGWSIRNSYLNKENKITSALKKNKLSVNFIIRVLKYFFNKLNNFYLSENSKIAAFRSGGEIHYWMYDRFSLTRLLKQCGFKNIEIKNPFNSNIENWSAYELDVKGDMVYDPTSLFMEAIKPSDNKV